MKTFFEKEFTFDRVSRIFFITIITTAVLAFAYYIKDALIPFFIGWLIASVFMPVVKFFQYKLRFKLRILGIFATGLCVIALMALFFYMFIPPAIEEVKKTGALIQKVEARYSSDMELQNTIDRFIGYFFDSEHLRAKYDDNQIIEYAKKYIPQAFNFVKDALMRIFNLLSLVFVLLYTFFIMLYYEVFREGFYRLLPEQLRKPVHRVIDDITYSTKRYFRGQSIIALCVGILFSIGFLIIGLPMAIPMGLFIGALNLIPYAQVIGVLPTVILCGLHSYDTGRSFWNMLIFAMLVFCIVQIFQDTVLTPRIMGKVTGLNPAIILLCLSIGGSLFGIVGIIMALPLAPMLLIYYRTYILKDPVIKPEEQHKK